MAEDKNLNNNDLNAADELTNAPQEQQPVEYTDDNIRHLSDMEHVRTRPGMYIGRLGDGNLPEDGIYVLLKEVVDNSIDEFKMGAGARLEIDIEDHLRVSVRDYGRGIPQGKLVEAVSVLNTGGKYDSKAFKKSVGLNGVGVKAVNALSSHFEVKSFRDGKVRHLKFEKGILKSDKTEDTEDENGTFIFFEPDNTLFKNYSFHDDFVETMLRNYTYLNTGLTIMHNGRRILSLPSFFPWRRFRAAYSCSLALISLSRSMKGFIRVRMMYLANDFPLDCSPSTMTCSTMADFSP